MNAAYDKQIKKLNIILSNGNDLLAKFKDFIPYSHYDAWEITLDTCLSEIYRRNSDKYQQIMNAANKNKPPTNHDLTKFYRRKIMYQIQIIESLKQYYEEQIDERDMENSSEDISIDKKVTNGDKIFLVHGHSKLDTVARFLEKLVGDENITILKEKPSKGDTIIEKFEKHADVNFAVALLTADDKGGPKGVDPKDYQLRARQNVIFEMGYCIGRLGRSNVCALYEEDVEIPSDYKGVIFIKLDDNGAWKNELAKELKDAGISVDMNKI